MKNRSFDLKPKKFGYALKHVYCRIINQILNYEFMYMNNIHINIYLVFNKLFRTLLRIL